MTFVLISFFGFFIKKKQIEWGYLPNEDPTCLQGAVGPMLWGLGSLRVQDPRGLRSRGSEAHQVLGFRDSSEQWLVDSSCLRPW